MKTRAGCFYSFTFSICDSLNTLHLRFLMAVPRDEILSEDVFAKPFFFFFDHNYFVNPMTQHLSIIFTRENSHQDESFQCL